MKWTAAIQRTVKWGGRLKAFTGQRVKNKEGINRNIRLAKAT